MVENQEKKETPDAENAASEPKDILGSVEENKEKEGETAAEETLVKGGKTLKKALKASAEKAVGQAAGGPIERVVKISRVSKVVKGGKNFSFSAVVIAGDGKGSVGIGYGKSNEVAGAITKGAIDAKKNFVKLALSGSTIPYEVMGKFKATKVMLKPAGPGTGVIAGGAVRAICDSAGIKNILTKCLGSRNPVNVVKAAMDGFGRLRLQRKA